ncbi:MAG: hypothetical protein WC667_13310 [Sulfurimonas sp.]|jgi:hypothetical protein
MNFRIKEVIPTDNYKLILTFKNDEKAVYEYSGLLDFSIFTELKDINYFKQFFVQHRAVT